MTTKFELFTPSTGHANKDVPTEYVRITGPVLPPPPVDEVFRVATAEDKVRFAAEYEAFKKTAPAKEPEAVVAPVAPAVDAPAEPEKTEPEGFFKRSKK